MNEKEITELAIVNEKLDGIHTRLDRINGTVARTKGRLREVEDFILIEKSKNKTKAWVTDNLMGIFSTILSSIVIFLILSRLGGA